MNDQDALLAAISAEPDDDTPRLVYADWLGEHGQGDRAEFIRVQCQLEHVPRRSAEEKRLAARDQELRTRLFAHLAELGFTRLTFRRGFVDQITSGLLHFRDHASALTPDDAPAFALKLEEDERDRALWESHYNEYSEAVGQLGARPELRRCVSLDLPCLGIDPTSYLFESEQFVNLRRLNFPDNEAGPDIESVASPTFANLRWANFNSSNSANGRPSIVPLAESPHLANLEYLDFGSNRLWDVDAKAVAAAGQWSRLRYLNLSSASFSAEAIATLFATSHLPALAELDLSRSFGSFGETADADAYISGIVGSPLFRRLPKLWLWGNGITDAGAKALAAAPRDVKLELLALTDNPIGGAGRRALWRRYGPGVCVFGRSHA